MKLLLQEATWGGYVLQQQKQKGNGEIQRREE